MGGLRTFCFGVFALLLGVVGLATPASATLSAEGSPSQPHVMLGAYPKARNGQTQQQAVTDLESSLGRSLALVREYDRWNSTFPTAYDLWLRDSGHVPMLSVGSRLADGTPVTFRSVADS